MVAFLFKFYWNLFLELIEIAPALTQKIAWRRTTDKRFWTNDGLVNWRILVLGELNGAHVWWQHSIDFKDSNGIRLIMPV